MAAPANVTLCCTGDTLATVSEGQSMIQLDSDTQVQILKRKKKTLERHKFFQLELMRERLKPAAVGSHSASMR